MQKNILTVAAGLSDDELLVRLPILAAAEREATAELVAHLAVLDTRPVLYAADGYGSLFGYCTQALRLSEDAACNRTKGARACRRFPRVLDLLAAGTLSLTAIRLLARHLTEENHQAVLARAENKSRPEIEALVAELAPRPDAPSLVRKLPVRVPVALTDKQPVPPLMTAPTAPIPPPVPSPPPAPRPVIEALAPQRYRVQFTIGQQGRDNLRSLQALLRREIPDGDPGTIVERSLALMLATVEREKLGKTTRRRPRPVIRPGADKDAAEGPLPPRHPSQAVKAAVWARDEGRCAFVSRGGRRCEERTFLEFHHRRPYALRGEATVENIALRCRRHNQYEADLVFGDVRPGVHPAAATPPPPAADSATMPGIPPP